VWKLNSRRHEGIQGISNSIVKFDVKAKNINRYTIA